MVLILGLTLTFTTPTWAVEICAGGAGTLITGADGTTKYCLSNKQMNWWSANAWCDALGMKLFNIHTECSKVQGGTQCAQVKDKLTDEYGWTQNVPSVGSAYYVSVYGGIEKMSRSSKSYHALCMSKN